MVEAIFMFLLQLINILATYHRIVVVVVAEAHKTGRGLVLAVVAKL